MISGKVQLTQALAAQPQFVATTGSEHHMVLADAAGKTGPKPIELIAVALAGCTAFDVTTVLRQKYRQKVMGYEVRERPSVPLALVRFFVAILTLLLVPAMNGMGNEEKHPWRAPKEARELRNSVAVTQRGLKSAAQLYQQNCVICHGRTGASNGPAAKSLPQKPANFTDEKMMRSTTDGELFWKITTGRAPMPSWQDRLSETQRWELVNYLRMLAMRAQYRYLGTAD